MDMDEFRFPRQITREIYNAFRKENEAISVVRITQGFFFIKSGAIKKFRLLNKIDGQIFRRFKRPDFALNRFIAQWQIELPIKRFDSGKFFFDAAIKRSDDADLMSVAREKFC